MTPPKVIICFEAHRTDGKVWAVRVGRRWILGSNIQIGVPIVGVYKGPTARQPRAYFSGRGYVSIYCGTICISPFR